MKDKKVLIIIILILVVLGLVGYIGYSEGWFVKDKPAESSNPEVKEEKKEELKEEEANKIMAKIRTFEEDTYYKEKIEADSFSSESKIKYAISEELLLKDNIKKTDIPTTQKDMGNQLSITWKVVKDRVKDMFGSKTQLEFVSTLSLAQAGAGCYGVKGSLTQENEDESLYYLDGVGCDVGWRFDHFEKKIVDAVKYSDRVEITMKVLNLNCVPDSDNCTVSTTLNKSRIGEVKQISDEKNEEYNLETYYEKADAFKYTFNLEGNNYYFVSSEHVK